jgi:hypothetical protein
MSAREQDRPLSARLDKLGADLVAAKQRVRECELAARRAEADVTRLRDAVVDAHADGDEQRAAKASRERDKAESDTLRDTAERLEGARRAAQRADVERATFAAENLPGLVREHADQAHAVARRVEEALDGLAQAHGAWVGVAQDVAGLCRLAGQETRDVPRFPAELAELVRHARRVGAVDVPAPLPVGIASAPTREVSARAAK